jgi:hypothetical protein
MGVELTHGTERIVHPGTGELLEQLHAQPPETLADALAAVRARQAELKNMTAALETELRRRMALRGRKLTVFGDWEVEIKPPSNESVWDADELEATLQTLVDDGVARAGELTGIINRDPTVSRTAANELLRRLSGSARTAVDRCRTFRPKGSGSVRVARSVALPASDHAEIEQEV